MSAWRAPEAEARRRRGLRVRVLRRDGLEEVEGVEEDGRRLAAAVEGGVEVRAVKYEAWGAVVVEEVEVEVVEEEVEQVDEDEEEDEMEEWMRRMRRSRRWRSGE